MNAADADQRSLSEGIVERICKWAGEICLVAIGVKAVLPEGLNAKLSERGWLQTDDRYQTSVKNVYGAGDIIGLLDIGDLALDFRAHGADIRRLRRSVKTPIRQQTRRG